MSSKSKEENQLTILIPVYNEEKTLKKVIDKTASLNIGKYELIIVDDASSDESPKIIEDFLKDFTSKTVTVKHFRHPLNRGKGAAIQTALKHASGEYFVIQDADLEYEPKDIPKLLKRALEGDCDVVYGSRFLGNMKGMPRANYIANRGYNIMLRVLYGVKLTDMHTCYKMIRTPLIKRLKIRSNGFDYATELISKLLKKGVKIQEIPIGFNGRTKKEGKKINIMDGIECAYKLVRFRFTTKESLFEEKSTTFWRFIIVGSAGFLTNYFILVALTSLLGIGHVIAEFIAAILAMQTTFFLHDSWTYRLHAPAGTEMHGMKTRYVSYIISNSFGVLVTATVFSVLFNVMNRLPSLLIAAVVGLIWNYTVNTYVIWQKKKIG